MAKMPIELLDLRRNRTDLLSTAVRLANTVQGQYFFSLLEDDKSYDLLFAVHNDTDIKNFLTQFRRRKSEWRGFHPFIFAAFDTAINVDGVHNLFSVDWAIRGFTAVTIHNVENVLIPSQQMTSYVIFQLAFFALKFSGCDIPFHDENRDCLFDYRENKALIVNTIRSGHICDECRKALQEKNGNVSPAQLTSVFSLLSVASKIAQGLHMATQKIKPKVFIGSSVEGLNVARAIQMELEHDSEVEIWNQSDVFVLGSATLEALETALENYDFGIFVFTPDDQITTRGNTSPVARDNVIFEAGLFIGKIGRHRSFIVKPRNVQIQVPSDLNGITVADYDSSKSNINAAVGSACTKIRDSIRNIRLRDP